MGGMGFGDIPRRHRERLAEAGMMWWERYGRLVDHPLQGPVAGYVVAVDFQ